MSAGTPRPGRRARTASRRNGTPVGTCPISGKRQYADEREARRRIRLSKKSPTHKTQRQAYQCRHCGLWHTSSRRKR